MRSAVVCAVLCSVFVAGFLAPVSNAQSCSGDTISDLQAVAGKYDIGQFVNLLKETDAIGDGAYTIFAPTDSAVQAAVQALGLSDASKWKAQDKYIITQVLLYHIAPGVLPTTGISRFGASVSTLANNLKLCSGDATLAGDKNVTDNFNSLKLTKTKTAVTVFPGLDGSAGVPVIDEDVKLACQPDIIIHTIGKVLLPCDFTKYLKEPLPKDPPPSPPMRKSPPVRKSPPAPCKTGSVYKNLGSTPGATLGEALVSVIDPTFAGTVFVPSDKALAALLKAFNVTMDGLDSLAAALPFKDLLNYHVVPDTVIGVAPITPGTKIYDTQLAATAKQTFCARASPGTVSVSVERTGVLVTYATGDATVVDSFPVCGGAIHVIDAVMLPCAQPSAQVTELLTALQTPAATPSPPADSTDAPIDIGRGTTTRGVTLGGGSPTPTNSTPSGSTTPAPAPKNAAGIVAPSALFGLVVALFAFML